MPNTSLSVPLSLTALKEAIAKEVRPSINYRFMEFCGGHTYTLAKHALADILPQNIKMVHGPGCPVCVLSPSVIKQAICLVKDYQTDIILCSYGDVLRVPDDTGDTLLKAKTSGADVRMVYSCLDALDIAIENKDKSVIFFAVGFETTAPLSAAVLIKAKELGIKNFFIFANHLATAPAIKAVLERAKDNINGIVAPGHVLAVTGLAEIKELAEIYNLPMCVSGFTAEDILMAILTLVKQVNAKKHTLLNAYKRVVKDEGNPVAVDILHNVFSGKADFNWRGLGLLKNSSFTLSDEYKSFNITTKFNMPSVSCREPAGCICAKIITGEKSPCDCPLFGKICTSDNPKGSCMVSSEGTCGAFYKYSLVK